MTLRVNVKLLGVFRGLTGKDRIQLEFKGAQVRDVVLALAESLPLEARALLIDPELDDPRSNVLILLNGREISVLEGMETAVTDGDEVTIVPVAHGG